MKFFLDTEFIESGRFKPLELLSIGIVSEDGRELYVEHRDADTTDANQWVRDNVLPHLQGPRLSMGSIQERILAFVGDGKPEFWGYYADYDWVVFCGIFGRMVDLPKGWPMYCRDIKQLCDALGNPKLPEQASSEHHALNDARWNQAAYEFLTN
jgi:hypothetical protein